MGKVNVFLWIPLPLYIMAAVFCIVGLATNEWIVTDTFDEGLYKRCTDGSCKGNDASSLVVAARTILIDVVLVISYTTTMLVLYILMVSKDKVDRYARCCSYKFPSSILCSSILACVLIAIADILMAVEAFQKNDYSGTKLGYSFFLTVVAALALPVAGGLAFHGKIPTPKSKVAPTEGDEEPTKIVVGGE